MTAFRARFGSFGSGDGELLTGYLCWIEFLNGGLEVLEYTVESLDIVFGSTRVALDKHQFASAGAIILPGRTSLFYLPVVDAPIDPPLQGRAKYTVLYGHPSSGIKFKTTHEFLIAWQSNADTGRFEPLWTTIGSISHEPVSPAVSEI